MPSKSTDGRFGRSLLTAMLLLSSLPVLSEEGKTTRPETVGAIQGWAAGEWQVSGSTGSTWRLETDAEAKTRTLYIDGTTTAERSDGLKVEFAAAKVTLAVTSGRLLSAELSSDADGVVSAFAPADSTGRPDLQVVCKKLEYSIGEGKQSLERLKLLPAAGGVVTVNYGADSLFLEEAEIVLSTGNLTARGKVLVVLAPRKKPDSKSRRKGFDPGLETRVKARGLRIDRSRGTVNVAGPVMITQPGNPEANFECGKLRMTLEEGKLPDISEDAGNRKKEAEAGKKAAASAVVPQGVSRRFLSRGLLEAMASGGINLTDGDFHSAAERFEYYPREDRLLLTSPGGEIEFSHRDPETGKMRSCVVAEGVEWHPDTGTFRFMGKFHLTEVKDEKLETEKAAK